jgi:hypothetical protein
MLLDDVRYLVDNAQLDFEDMVTVPLHVASESSVLRSPRFYLTLAGVIVAEPVVTGDDAA